MVKQRSSNALIAELLKHSRLPIKPTRLMYEANMSWREFQTYMGHLTEHGLLNRFTIGEDVVQTFYETTPKGHKYLELFSELEELMEAVNVLQVELNSTRVNPPVSLL